MLQQVLLWKKGIRESSEDRNPTSLNSGENKYREDAELLQLYQSGGNNEYLGTLLQRYSVLLFGVCMKYLGNAEEAKDAVQQVFLKVIKDIGKYKVEHFRSWLYMVAKNHCLMTLRKKGIRTTDLDERTMGNEKEEELRDLLMEKEEKLNRLTEALDMLNEPQQACIRLFFLEKKSYREVAALTGYSELQVKSHIQNGKRNLKISLERKNPS